ncbi:MAG: hypothetical protein IBJ10_10965 [Phycisphaerales bacterium]|nr:hypothetical protein [Phycisphaerales bacterium]
MSAAAHTPLAPFLDAARAAATRAGVFGETLAKADALVCAAPESAAPAEYRLFTDAGALWVGLFTADRWLSQSIEQDLVHTGDKLEELMEEELADQQEPKPAQPPKFEHFRDDDKVFTFRTRLPFGPADASAGERAARWLLACEAMFRNLGDMQGGDED